MIEGIKIIGLGVIAAVAYGIVHDNFTARLCVEYFTIGHPPIFGTDSPTLLALGWGVVATWWVGFGLGILMAVTCRIGSEPRLTARDLLGPLGRLLAVMALLSTLAWIVGFGLASGNHIWLVGDLALEVPPSRHRYFLGDLWAHLAAYASAFVGGLVLVGWAVARRYHLSKTRTILLTDGT